MKKLLLLGLASATITGMCAADIATTPLVVEEVIGMNISSNGKYVGCQDYLYNSAIINTQTQGLVYYLATIPGNGNCLSDDGILVGQDASTGTGVIMINGDIIVPDVLENKTSAIDAITPDGTRACGYTSSLLGATTQVPFYMDLAADGSVENYVLLPRPDKDLLGDVPHWINANAISADGKTISGQIEDGTGFFHYPIVWKQNDNGEWEYSYPSQAMFNPNNLPIPQWPEYKVNPPQIYEFMTDANREKWIKDLSDYQSGASTIDPWDHISEYMNDDEYNAYLDAYKEASEEAENEFYQKIDEYWVQVNKIIKDSNFILGCNVMSADGKYLVGTLSLTDQEDGVSDDYTGLQPVIFNLDTDTFHKVTSDFVGLYPKQMLADGTVSCIDIFSYCDFIITPETWEVNSLDSYLEKNHPDWIPWMIENLGLRTDAIYGNLIPAGYISFSQDMSVMAGGVTEGMGMTYIFVDDNAGVESLGADLQDGRTRVYDLAGRKVIDTRNLDSLQGLKKGIYIINGKKVKI